MSLQIGDAVPDFTAINQHGEEVKLSSYKGKKLVIYFYPKDNTPTCTDEACNLRDNYAAMKKQGYEILGVSPDSPKSHQKFIKKFNLPFDLISDPDQKLHHIFGTWGEKMLFGRTYMGTLRKTFVIDEKGRVADVIEKVVSKDHAAQIMG